MAGLQRGQRASGDLIPWTMAQQFQDDNFPQLSGARIVRIATHPEYQRMGYGTRALDLLQKYYQGDIVSVKETEGNTQIPTVEDEDIGLLEETLAPRKNLPPLLLELSERPPESLNYLGVSFGLTSNLLRFWKKAGYAPTYLRQTKNDLTGEHTTIMLKDLEGGSSSAWLPAFFTDFKRRLVSLLGFELRSLPPSLALSLLHNKAVNIKPSLLGSDQLLVLLTPYDVKRLELYSNNMADHHLVTDLLPALARLVMTQQLGDLHLSPVQQAILVGLGLEHKTVDTLSTEVELPSNQLLALFNRAVRKIAGVLRTVLEQDIQARMDLKTVGKGMTALPSLDAELEKAAADEQEKQREKVKDIFVAQELSQYAVKGSDTDWASALNDKKTTTLSIKTGEKRSLDDQPEKEHKKMKENQSNSGKKKKKDKKKK